ncbi:MAG TPA: hypothetical protein VG649_21475, partial [Candidatus Angelobacter sp.]|nr:hypothetical protein [Candidatus Angelobacter sp.]
RTTTQPTHFAWASPGRSSHDEAGHHERNDGQTDSIDEYCPNGIKKTGDTGEPRCMAGRDCHTEKQAGNESDGDAKNERHVKRTSCGFNLTL